MGSLLCGWLICWQQTNSGRDKSVKIAKKLEVMARDFDSGGDLYHARDFFGAASKWYQQLGNKAKVAEITVCVAQGWVKEAVARMSSEWPSYMAAGSFYENAIQAYRTIPRAGAHGSPSGRPNLRAP